MSSIKSFTRLGVCALVFATAACTGMKHGVNQLTPLPTEQFPLAVETQTTGARLTAHPYGLSGAQAEYLRVLATDWAINGDGLILIEAPVCACDEGAFTAYDTRDALVAFGVPADSIRMIGYEADAAAPIRVSFQRVSAKVYDCGVAWEDVTRSGDNQPTSNFGCAVSSNLAAIIERPADIVRPRDIDPPDAGRRQVVIGLYRNGQATAAEVNQNADGTISDAVN